MKGIKEYILETQTDDAIQELVDIFKSTVLKDQKISKDDFEELDNGTFNLCNVPQDGKLAKDFHNKRSRMSHGMHCYDDSHQVTLGIPLAGKDDIFIRLNLDTENGKGYKKGDIISVDMSKEIKDRLV